MSNSTMFLVITLLFILARLTAAGNMNPFVGVCDGRNGDNLPPPAQIVSLYKKINVAGIRLYEPVPDLIVSLQGTGLLVALGPRNEEIKTLAERYEFALNWVKTFIAPYKNVAFSWITVGNEVIEGEIGRYVPQAMKNLKAALTEIGNSKIHVTTVISTASLANSYPPSAGVFKPAITELITEIVSILSSTDSPLMVNVYPYFAYASDPSHVTLEYATFRSTSPVVTDGKYQYTNIFDASLDAFNAALEKINHGSVKVYVAETGWPTRGNVPYTSVENARAYNQGLLKKLTTGNKGTPRRPNVPVMTFFFEMFNEDLKEGDVEKSFGFFNPDMAPVYDMWNINVSSYDKEGYSWVIWTMFIITSLFLFYFI
ncbi:Glycoside hydrolase family 17 [Arabidopsis suecica]|uniref:glucan endo-1,3-beta-D-glucosidase n=1 Tax=Arabidopsis suecica TaxID=45249 RepID=A0A8T2BSS7_ARASU|nr:Glycoside hydrolase family 17 [Arabidopsis suecica]